MTALEKYPHLFTPRPYRSEAYSTEDTVTIEVSITPVRPDYSSDSVKKRAEALDESN